MNRNTIVWTAGVIVSAAAIGVAVKKYYSPEAINERDVENTKVRVELEATQKRTDWILSQLTQGFPEGTKVWHKKRWIYVIEYLEGGITKELQVNCDPSEKDFKGRALCKPA